MFSLVERRPGLVGDHNAMELQRVYLEGKWKTADVLTARARALPTNVVLFSQDFLPEQQIRSSPFFLEYLKPRNILWGAGWTFDLDGEAWCFALCRSAEQGPFGVHDRDLLGAAAPRMSRAMAQVNYVASRHGDGVKDALDTRNRAYAMIDHRGLVSHLSAPGAAILDDSLQLVDGKLCATDLAANDTLQNIALAARYGAVGAGHAGLGALEEFVITRPGGRAPIVVTPNRTRASPLDALPGEQIVLSLTDLARHPLPHAAPLKQLFHLTAREIEIAQRLAVGDDAHGIAEALALKPSYVRQITKSILAKTGLHRIGQLVAMLARLPNDG